MPKRSGRRKGPGSGGNRRNHHMDPYFVKFVCVRKCRFSASEHIRRIQDRLQISSCAYYRSLAAGAATAEVYICILYTLQEMIEERYGRLFSPEEFPMIRDLKTCPAVLQQEFDEYKKEMGWDDG